MPITDAGLWYNIYHLSLIERATIARNFLVSPAQTTGDSRAVRPLNKLNITGDQAAAALAGAIGFIQPFIRLPSGLGMTGTRDFAVLRLHNRSDDAWAIIERPAGAIAKDKCGRLLMKLTKADAEDIAAAMTLALEDARADAVDAATSKRRCR